MRKYCLSLLLLASFGADAQTAPPRPPKPLEFGNIGSSAMVNGKLDAIKTNRQRLLSNPRIISPDSQMRVLNYVVSVMPTGQNYFGPFKVNGAELPENVKAKIMEHPSGKLYLEHVKVMHEGTQCTANPIVINYAD